MCNISVIIPVYNVEDYVLDCLKSIQNQTMTNNIECILIDDCGTDHSMDIISDFIFQYKGNISFIVLHHQHNKGLSAARNTGISVAKGQYLLFLDSDDKLYPNSLELLYGLTLKYPGVELVQGSTFAEHTNAFLLNKDRFPEYSNNKKWISNKIVNFTIQDPAYNRLIKRDVVITNSLYFAEGYIQEDTIWAYTIHNKIGSIAFCFEPTYYYRMNPFGIMKGADKHKKASSFCRVFNYVYKKMYEQDKISYSEIVYLEKNASRAFKEIGDEALNMIIVLNNPLFKYLIILSSNFSKSLINKVYRKIIMPILRLLLTSNKLFSYNVDLTDRNTIL